MATKPKSSNKSQTQKRTAAKFRSPFKFSNRLFITFVVLFAVIGSIFVYQAAAAPKRPPVPTTPTVALSISPASQTFQVGQTASFAIVLDTGGQSVNAVQAIVTYPADKFDFVDVDATSSVFEVEPPIENVPGTVTIPRATSTSVNSSNAPVATVHLRPKASGRKISVNISSTSVVLRTSDSVNVLERVSGGQYTIR